MAELTPFGASETQRLSDIRWRDWDRELYDDEGFAQRLRLLLIAPGWHPELVTLDATLFADPRVVGRLALELTPVRVASEERPDLATRYGEPGRVVVALLSPDGELLDRFTDPEADRLVETIDHWLARWRDEQDTVLAELEAERVLRQAARPAQRGELTPAVLDIVLDRANESDDLPDIERVRLWLYAHRRRADLESERRARRAIQRRVDGGSYDAASGGFRHCAHPECAVRLAEDQGRWLLVLAGIAAEDSEAHEWVLQAVTQTVEFVDGELRNSSGAFRNRADSEQVLAASNATVARGLLACGIVFDRADWRSRGRTAVDFLVQRMRAGEAGFYHGWDGVPYTLGLLNDQVAAAQALLDAYESTGAIDYLYHAQTVARLLERQFQTAEDLLADTDPGTEPVGLLEEPRFSALDNAEAAELLIRLSHLTHDDRYVEMAYAILGAVVGGIETLDLEAACAVARVIDRLLSIEPEIKVIAFAPPGEIDSTADPLHAEALRLALAAHTVQRLHPEFDDVLAVQLGVPITTGGAVCFVWGEYGPLLTRPDELLPAIERAVEFPG